MIKEHGVVHEHLVGLQAQPIRLLSRTVALLKDTLVSPGQIHVFHLQLKLNPFLSSGKIFLDLKNTTTKHSTVKLNLSFKVECGISSKKMEGVIYRPYKKFNFSCAYKLRLMMAAKLTR